MNEKISTIMTVNPVTLSSSNNLAEVQNIFLNNKIHHLPIVDDGKLVGLVTTYDLWKQNKAFSDYPNIKVGEVMNTNIAKVSADDKVGTAAELFLDNRFHALPVITNNKLVGNSNVI